MFFAFNWAYDTSTQSGFVDGGSGLEDDSEATTGDGRPANLSNIALLPPKTYKDVSTEVRSPLWSRKPPNGGTGTGSRRPSRLKSYRDAAVGPRSRPPSMLKVYRDVAFGPETQSPLQPRAWSGARSMATQTMAAFSPIEPRSGGLHRKNISYEADEKVNAFEKRVENLDEQLTTIQKMINGTWESRKRIEEEVRSANEGAVAQLRNLQRELEARNSQLRNDLHKAQATIRALDQRHEEEQARERQRLGELHSRISALQVELSAAEAKVKAMSRRDGEVEALETRQAKLKSKVSTLQDELDTAQARTRAMGEAKTLDIQELAKAQSKISLLQDEISKTQATIGAMSRRDEETKVLETRQAEWQSKVSTIQDELSQAKAEIQKMGQRDVETKVLEVEQQAKWESKVSSLQAELSRAQAKIEDAASRNDESQEKLKKKHEAEWRLKESYYEVKLKIAEAEIEALKRRHEEEKSLAADEEARNTKREEQLAIVEKRFKDLLESHAAAKIEEFKSGHAEAKAILDAAHEELRTTVLHHQSELDAVLKQAREESTKFYSSHMQDTTAFEEKLKSKTVEHQHQWEATFDKMRGAMQQEIDEKIRLSERLDEEWKKVYNLRNDLVRENESKTDAQEIRQKDVRLLDEDCKSLRTEKEKVERELSSLEAKHRGDLERIEKYQIDMADLTKTLEEETASKQQIIVKNNAKLEEMEKQHDETNKQIKETKKQIKELETTNEDLEQQIRINDQAKKKVVGQLNEANKQIEDLENKAKELEQQITANDQVRNEAVAKELEEANRKTEALEAQTEQLEAKIEELEFKIKEVKKDELVFQRQSLNEVENHKKTIMKLNESLEAAERDMEIAKKEVRAAEEEVELAKQRAKEEVEVAKEKAKEEVQTAQEKTKLAKQEAKEEADRAVVQITEKLNNEERRRRILFEQVQLLRGNIRIMCRMRPPSVEDGALLEYQTRPGQYHDKDAILTIPAAGTTSQGNALAPTEEEFERVFLPDETNGDVFDEISQLVQSFVDGKRVCIFCYGQSGTGKTYTMCNTENFQGRGADDEHENDGIIPRSKKMIFKEIQRLRELGWGVNLEGCCYEVYLNQCYLLRNGQYEKRDMVAPSGGGYDESTYPVRGADNFQELCFEEDFDHMYTDAVASRHSAATATNPFSSRSHFVVNLKFTAKSSDPNDGLKPREGSLYLVDLAGSERSRDAKTSGVTLDEGNAINMSLSTLASVLEAISSRQGLYGKINAPDGACLSQVLYPALAKTSKCMTLMFVMISPRQVHRPETINTLNFVKRAKKKSGGRAQVASGNEEGNAGRGKPGPKNNAGRGATASPQPLRASPQPMRGSKRY